MLYFFHMENIERLVAHLKEFHLGVISTVSPENEPQGATVDFLTAIEDGKLILYFLTRRHSRKFENLMHNPRIGFVIGFGPEANTVQLQGKSHRLTENEEIDRFFEYVEERPELKELYYGNNQVEPWSEIKGVGYEAVRVEIDWARWMYRDEEGKIVTEQIIG